MPCVCPCVHQVDVILPKGTELTPELLQRIAAYNSTLGRALRQRSMKRREVMLQSAKVLGVAGNDDDDDDYCYCYCYMVWPEP
jgi:hypothetical protein